MLVSQPVAVAPVVTETTQPVATIGGVPMSMVEYFDLDYRNIDSREKKQLNEIYDYFSRQDKPLEAIWSDLRDIERRRGLTTNEPRHARVWRWIKLTKEISSLQSQRDTL